MINIANLKLCSLEDEADEQDDDKEAEIDSLKSQVEELKEELELEQMK